MTLRVKPKLRVLLVNDFKDCGGAEWVLFMTCELLKDRYDISCFYGSEKVVRPVSLLDYIYSKKQFEKIKLKLDIFQPDIIHVKNYYHLLSPSILTAINLYKKGKNVKVLMTAHDYHLLAPNSGYCHFGWFNDRVLRLTRAPTIFNLLLWKWDSRGMLYSIAKQLQWIYSYKVKKVDQVFDLLIAPSHFMASVLKKNFTGIPVEMLRNPMLVAQNHQGKNKSDNVVRIVFVGRLSPEKGLCGFLKALSKVEIEYVFTIIGEGEELEDLRKLVDCLRMQEKVVFKGFMLRSEVMQELRKNDIMVLPSVWYENAPLSLIEGCISGLKIMTMNYGGMKELAELCGNSFLFDEDFRHLEKGLYKLQNQGFKQCEGLREIFSPKKYCDTLVELYERPVST